MTIYQSVVKPMVIDRLTDWCRDKWGVNAPAVVTVIIVGLIAGGYLGALIAVAAA